MFKNFKCLIIGYGSIGKRHAKLLSKICGKSSVFILSKKKIKNYKSFENLNDVCKINFNYIVVSSPTSAHYNQIKFIEKNYKDTLVLVEKPLLHKCKKIKIRNNKFFVGYNLRYHPVIKFLKMKINKKKVFSTIINCSSFLPEWRKNINYKNIYSSKKKLGGGVLLDLSHELDYFQFLFGKLKYKNINFIKKNKISDLKVNVEDNAIIQGKQKKMDFLININFFSKNICREIILETNNETIKSDLINYSLKIYSKKNNSVKKIKLRYADTYFEQHLNLLKRKFNDLCSFDDGLKLINLIDNLKKNSKNKK